VDIKWIKECVRENAYFLKGEGEGEKNEDM
jgi:hypothetical protein